jgi:hypothetical protein
MPQHDARAYLYDIATACRLILEFTSGKGLERAVGNGRRVGLVTIGDRVAVRFRIIRVYKDPYFDRVNYAQLPYIA